MKTFRTYVYMPFFRILNQRICSYNFRAILINTLSKYTFWRQNIRQNLIAQKNLAHRRRSIDQSVRNFGSSEIRRHVSIGAAGGQWPTIWANLQRTDGFRASHMPHEALSARPIASSRP